MSDALNEWVGLYYRKPPGENGVLDMSDDACGRLYRRRRARDMSTTSGEIMQAMAENRKVTKKFRLRTDRGISEGMVLVHRGQHYDIKGISEDAGRVYMYLVCERNVGYGGKDGLP
ncbi:MAG: phage head closure protein [Lachnospiraceae bacterium]|nr:phage head closure protein [Lachnospiraceae bacterium]